MGNILARALLVDGRSNGQLPDIVERLTIRHAQVREMFGVMTARNAASVAIITSGMFTQEAKNFAEGKPVDLIDGSQLVQLVVSVQAAGIPRAVNNQSVIEKPADMCPNCGSGLIEKTARRRCQCWKAIFRMLQLSRVQIYKKSLIACRRKDYRHSVGPFC